MTLQRFGEALEKGLKSHQYGDSPVELYEPIDYIMSLGGKRVRPLLTLVTAALFDDDWQKAVKPAMGVEVFHNFTLMHDDIMDQAPLRRGQETVHTRWDTNRAILSGDVMLVAAYQLLLSVEDDKLRRVMERFNRTAAEVCEGQQMDMLLPIKAEVSKEDYLEMIRLKTSVLLGFSCELGGMVSGADTETCKKLYSIGENIGLGFQQMDDVLDLYADAAKFGKQIGGDILENKKTWLVLRAFEKAQDTPLEKELAGWFTVTHPEKKIAGVRSVFDQLNIREEGEALAAGFFDKATEELKSLEVKNTEVKDQFLTLIKNIREREK